MWAGRATATMITAAILVAACAGAAPPKVTVRGGVGQVSYYGTLLRKKCPTDNGRVTLDLTALGVQQTFTCRQVRQTTAKVNATLAASVGSRHDAAHRIERVDAFDKALSLPPLPRSEFVWFIALSPSTFQCTRAGDIPFRRSEMSDAISTGDNPVHWLKVEAAITAGECPDQLAALYRTISLIGYAKAVADVRPVIAAIKVP